MSSLSGLQVHFPAKSHTVHGGKLCRRLAAQLVCAGQLLLAQERVKTTLPSNFVIFTLDQ